MLATLTPRASTASYAFSAWTPRDQTIDIRSNIGYVPQQLSIEPALTGRQKRGPGSPGLYGVPAPRKRSERVDEALDANGSWRDVADRPAGNLFRREWSGRLEGGTGVGQSPVTAWCSTKPTVGLDPIRRREPRLGRHVLKHAGFQFGMTVLLTTHYMERGR